MNVLMSGAKGLIGSALIPELEAEGHRVDRLTRSPRSGEDIRWDPDAGMIEGDLAGFDAVVHLAGESIAEGRWTSERKRRIPGEQAEGDTLAGGEARACGAAIRDGLGPRRSGTTEIGATSCSPRRASLAPCSCPRCARRRPRPGPAREAGVRVVHPRFGIALGTEGGGARDYASHLQARRRRQDRFRRQYWSWVSLDDVVGAIVHAIETDALSGPVNVVAPEPPTNAEYTRVLGRVLGRPDLLRQPSPRPASRSVEWRTICSWPAPASSPRSSKRLIRILLSRARRRTATSTGGVVAEWPGAFSALKLRGETCDSQLGLLRRSRPGSAPVLPFRCSSVSRRGPGC